MIRQHAHEQDGIVVVHIRDRQLTSDDHILRTSDELNKVLASTLSGTRLLLDFDRVERVASMMLGDLVALNKRAMRKGVQLQLCGFTPDVMRVVESSKLDRLFEILEDPPDVVISNR